jgi:hypothetical protein
VNGGWTGFVPEELPASTEARTLAEVLSAPESPRERRQRVAEERAAASRAAGGHESDGRNFINRVLGRDAGVPVDAVLARHADVPERAGDGVSDLRRARQILEQHGLDHVLPGRIQAVFSENGIRESPKYQPDPDTPEDVVLGRMREQAEDDRRWMRRYVMRHPQTAVRARRIADEHCTGPDCEVCRSGREEDAKRARSAAGQEIVR